MRNLFYITMIAAMLSAGTLLVSCSKDDDEPGETPAPEIIAEVFEDVVTVTAEGKGEVKLYFAEDMYEVTNPVNYMRDYYDNSIKFAATAKEAGKPISKTTIKEVFIPKTDAPKLLHQYSAIENEDDSTFFTFDFNLYNGTGTIGVSKAVFDDNGDDSNEMYFKFDVQVTFDRATGIYSCQGTDITPRFRIDDKFYIIEGYTVTNLDCKVCIKDMTYSITFDCHGKHFDYSGPCSKTYPIVINFTDGDHVTIYF